jgi:hypothetical protein
MNDIVNAAFNECPGASCGDYHRDFVMAKLVMFWLAALNGQNPAVPTRDELFERCCRRPQNDGSITILMPEPLGRPEPRPEPGTWWR